MVSKPKNDIVEATEWAKDPNEIVGADVAPEGLRPTPGYEGGGVEEADDSIDGDFAIWDGSVLLVGGLPPVLDELRRDRR